MQVRFFTIPIQGGEDAAEDLNRFLASQRILAIERNFVQDGSNSAWALCVSFEPAGNAAGRPPPGLGRRGAKIDYREILNEMDFTQFARLRSLRKDLAEAEGVPAYALFTNEQLAEMVQRRVENLAALPEIPGVGEARVEKYGARFLDLLRSPVPPPATAETPAP
jgi:superfamily II DNA helicase RecQ